MPGTATQKFLRRVITVFLVLATLAAATHYWRRATAQVYHTFTSPDGRFKVVVFRIPSIFAAPGDSGGASGYVRLYDSRSGQVLEQKDVEMVQTIDQMTWSSTNVDIKLFAEWKLPR
jgi:hypothetical protein